MSEFKVHPHSWGKRKGLPWPDPLTDWCVRHGCDHTEHPAYPRIVRELGRQAVAE